jgi:PAS domain S-box-containing protein
VRAFGHEEADLTLPTGARDEAGVLARAFEEMFQEVRRNQDTLQAEVAERRRTEAALRQSEQRLRLALGAAGAGVWEWDLATDQTTWDESVEAMAAIDRKTFQGTIVSWLELMHPEDVGNVPEARRRTVEENQPYAVEFRIRGREGDWRHWMARGDLLRGVDGRPLKLVGISWDVTEAKLAQEQIRQYAAELERKNREMEQFVYSVSHDLKSPLVTCKGFTGILKEDLADGKIAEALDSAQRVEHATQHMGRLIEDLLQLSRVGRITSQTETVDVSRLVSELTEELRLAAKPGVEVEIQQDMPAIIADPVAVSRLFQNLLVNAFRYGCTGEHPRIEIGSDVTGSEVRFFVRDNGPGIPPEYQKKVFGLFQRLEANQEGTGIGLAIVSKIMEVQGGRVWVESTPGAGATFWLCFPSEVLAQVEPALPRRNS